MGGLRTLMEGTENSMFTNMFGAESEIPCSGLCKFTILASFHCLHGVCQHLLSVVTALVPLTVEVILCLGSYNLWWHLTYPIG